MTPAISFPISARKLATKQKQLRSEGVLKQALDLRAHRTISWLRAAENMKHDHDVCFILLWIGFNAAYADADASNDRRTDRERFAEFTAKLAKLDEKIRIHDAVWSRYRMEIRVLIESKYLFGPFWNFQNSSSGFDEWSEQFQRHLAAYSNFVYSGNTEAIISMLFDCLYVLRNQLIHGELTWKSRVNRKQVEQGCSIIAYVLPLFIETMLNNPDHYWGEPFYPVVEKLPYYPSKRGD